MGNDGCSHWILGYPVFKHTKLSPRTGFSSSASLRSALHPSDAAAHWSPRQEENMPRAWLLVGYFSRHLSSRAMRKNLCHQLGTYNTYAIFLYIGVCPHDIHMLSWVWHRKIQCMFIYIYIILCIKKDKQNERDKERERETYTMHIATGWQYAPSPPKTERGMPWIPRPMLSRPRISLSDLGAHSKGMS